MRLSLELTGTSPLLMHNIRLADPDDEFAAEMKRITSKRTNKTKQDRDDLARLEWHGSLYIENGGVVFPSAGFKRCIRDVATIRKSGKKVLQGVLLTSPMYVPLRHDGPASVEELWENDIYRWRTAVGVSASKVIRVRPRFPAWGLSLEVEVLTDVIDLDAFVEIVHLAGRAEGLGDGRRIGYGRFTAEVKPA